MWKSVYDWMFFTCLFAILARLFHTTCTHCDSYLTPLAIMFFTSVFYDTEHYHLESNHYPLGLHDRGSELLHYEYALSSNYMGLSVTPQFFSFPSDVYILSLYTTVYCATTYSAIKMFWHPRTSLQQEMTVFYFLFDQVEGMENRRRWNIVYVFYLVF